MSEKVGPNELLSKIANAVFSLMFLFILGMILIGLAYIAVDVSIYYRSGGQRDAARAVATACLNDDHWSSYECYAVCDKVTVGFEDKTGAEAACRETITAHIAKRGFHGEDAQ